MPSPKIAKSIGITKISNINYIDALLGQTKWSDNNTTLNLSYSFPWENNSSAYFYGYQSNSYSNAAEPYGSQVIGFNTTQINSVQSALKVWSEVANITFSRAIDNQNNVGDLRFGFSSVVNEEEGVWGWAYYPSSTYPSGGDVWISTDQYYDSWSNGSYNFESLIHEIGHALGLKHPFESEEFNNTILSVADNTTKKTVMSYTNYENFTAITPMIYDIAAIQYLYGANYRYNSDDTEYTFSNNNNNNTIKTLWDGGGTDTISLDGISIKSIINLEPGSYSSIGRTDRADNIGIAYNCYIENVKGGSSDDTIRGNILSNYIYGNLGNDSIFGNDGDDWLYGGEGFDTIDGGSGNDNIEGEKGDDVINGGTGIDTAIFNGSIYDYLINRDEKTFIVKDNIASRDGLDTLAGIERIKFSDIVVCDDISYSSEAQFVYRIYQAAFARMPDELGFRYWEKYKNDFSKKELSTFFMNAPEFFAKYGDSISNNIYTENLYKNVLQREPDVAGLLYWQNNLNNGVLDRVEMLIEFSDCAENISLTSEHISNGYWLL